MLTNLKKVEKSIKKIQNLETQTQMIKDMYKLLTKEQYSLYTTGTLLKAVLTKDKNLRGLDTPKELKQLKLTNSNAIKSSSVSLFDYKGLLIGNKSLEKEKLLVDLLEGKNIYVRTPIMKQFVLKKIIGAEDVRQQLIKDGSFEIGLNTPYGECSFEFSLNSLDTEEENNIRDILNNFDAYKIHPDIGKKVIEKELDNNLVKYYNTPVFYFKDPDNEKVFEFVKK